MTRVNCRGTLILLSVCAVFLAVTSSPVALSARRVAELKKADEMVDAFEDALREKDTHKIGEFFDDDFVFEGCKKTFTKEKLIPMLISIDYDVIRVIRSQTQLIRVDSHRFIATMNKMFLPMTSELIVSNDWKLVSGRSLDCDEKIDN